MYITLITEILGQQFEMGGEERRRGSRGNILLHIKHSLVVSDQVLPNPHLLQLLSKGQNIFHLFFVVICTDLLIHLA